MESLPALICVALITVFFMVPMWIYIEVTERKARLERDKAIEAGRHEPVTIQPYVDLSVCMGSGACVTACPELVLRVIDGQAVAVNMSACIGHGVCVPACPVDAIELVFGSEKRGIDIPEVGEGFETNVKGMYIAGELGGMGLIAGAAEQGVQAMNAAATGLAKKAGRKDVIIVGAGPAGLSAALVAKQKGLDYLLVDQGEVGGVVRHYPRKKLVFIRPVTFPLYGRVNLKQLYKEELVKLFEDIVRKCGIDVATNERVERVKRLPDGGFEVTTVNRKVEAQRVILALGRGGTPRKLDVPGEDQEKVAYSLLEPEHYQNDNLLVVGGGDSAVEAAMQLGEQPGNKVVLSYRGDKINRPKEKNIKRLKEAVKKGQVDLLLGSQVKEVGADRVILDQKGEQIVLPNDHVFVFVGGVLPTKFLKDAGIGIKKHYGKRIEDADKEPERPPREPKAEAKAPPPRADGPRPPVDGPPTTLPPRVEAGAPTALLPHADDGRGETTVPRGAPPPAPGNDLPTQALAPLDLAPARDEDTNPGELRPALGDVPTALVSEQQRAEALGTPSPAEPRRPAPVPPPDDGPYDETPVLAPEAERPRGRREVTEIKPLRRVATLGADRSPAPEPDAPSATPGPSPVAVAPPTPSPAVPPPGANPPGATPPGATPAPSPGRVVAGPERPVAGEPSVTGISRGFSRATGRGPGARPGADIQGAPAEARPDGRAPRAPMDPVSAKVKEPDAKGATEPFVRAAEALLAEGKFGEALQMAADLTGLVERASATMSERDRLRSRRHVFELEGRAHLGLGDWESAISPFSAAAALAREDDQPAVLARVLFELGRACHHVGRFGEAEQHLGEALRVHNGGPEERASTLRLLGDLALRKGRLEDAERRFEEARKVSPDADGQARALRGRAHVLAVRGDFAEALMVLERAASMLSADARGEVLAGVQARAVELEIVMGAYGKALRRAEDLVTLTTRQHLLDHQAEAVSLLAETLAVLGMSDEAAEAASQVDGLARHLGPRGAEARIRAARAACEVNRPDLALGLLGAVSHQPDGVVDDLEAQHLAVRARALVRKDPAKARELATEALGRPSAMLIIRSARTRLDAALALLEAGSPSTARAAVKRGLKDVQGSGNRGLKLELLVAMYLAEPDHRVVEAVARSALKVLDELPEHCARPFRARGVIANALERWEDQGGGA